MRLRLFLLVITACVFQVSADQLEAAEVAESIVAVPAEVRLHGREARHGVLVEQVSEGRITGPVQGDLTWTVEPSGIVTVQDGQLIPENDGAATVTVRAGALSTAVKVTVTGMKDTHQWTFRNHVLPILAKAGCNSGACHGALAGKGGFRLSLRGYDPATDWDAMVNQSRGRRVELADPGRSLLLAKPTGALPHKGGLRFDTDSAEYRILAEWIASGAPGPSADDPVVQKIEVLPRESRLNVGQNQDVLVRAYYSDGRVEDVTRWAKLNSADETVAKVDEEGHVSVIGPGGGAITAWYASQIDIARVTSPYPNDVSDSLYTSEPRRSFVDDLVLEKLRDLRLVPSPLCSDEEFVRRAFLDTIGTLPTADETRAFLQDASEDRRDRLIESLLSRPEFDDYWTYRWSDVLLISGNQLRPLAVESYYKWVRSEIAKNTPWDEFVRKIVTSTGSSIENGASNFFALHQDPENMAENVSQAFLGLSIACAKCHNHPLEKWTNDQYYGFANLFSRVRAKGWGGDVRSGDGIRTLYVVPTGELVQPRTGRVQPPTPLDGDPVALNDPGDRRIPLADWLTSPENPYFTRSIVNRVWAAYFGVGLVESVDDLRRSNPPSNDALLTAAADFLIEQHYDLKALMRVILQSRTYQRSSLPVDGNSTETRFYSRYYPKRLMAEVLLDAIAQVTDVPTKFTHVAFPGGDRQETKFYQTGTRAIQLYDSAVESYFLQTFGRNAREITCECERSDEPSMVQVLHIANGDTVNQKLKEKDSRLTRLLESGIPSEQIVEDVFLLCLSRFPTELEKSEMVRLLNDVPAEDADQRRILLEDIFWSLISTREFLFNH